MSTSVPANTEQNHKSRATCWTLNNWTTQELDACRQYAKMQASYMCWSQEIGEENGTPHLQGYVHWSSPRSLAKFKKDISTKLHYETHMLGSAQQNIAYCQGLVKKKGNVMNPTFEEYGEVPKQGERTDWKKAIQDLEEADVIATIDNQPHLLPCISALQKYKQLSQKGSHRDVEVIVLIGPPGCGKTRYAYDTYPDLFSKPDGLWWDGYNGEDTILLDDYYGNLPYSQLLKVCDRYPLSLPVKGGFVPARYTRVIITSNNPVTSWYPEHTTGALIRRIKTLDIDHNNASQENISQATLYSPPPPPGGTYAQGYGP